MAEPTAAETRQLMSRLLSEGTIRRLDILHEAMLQAYRTGAGDTERRIRRELAS